MSGVVVIFPQIPQYARIAHPLQRLLRNDADFEINEGCKQAFEQLKEKLMSQPVLANFCRGRETELHTDASAVGFGAVLLQRQTDGMMHTRKPRRPKKPDVTVSNWKL